MRAIVVGGGIGGLFCAVALREAGLDATVYERYPRVRPAGAGITLWANALRLFQRYGMLEDLLARAGTFERSEFRTASGRTLASVSLRELVARYGLPTVCLHRHHVSDVLVRRLGDDGLRLGAPVVDVVEHHDRVRVLFADGGAVEGDVLIGADGVHSTVRSRLMPDARPYHDGQTGRDGRPGDLPAPRPRSAPDSGAGAAGVVRQTRRLPDSLVTTAARRVPTPERRTPPRWFVAASPVRGGTMACRSCLPYKPPTRGCRCPPGSTRTAGSASRP